MTCSGGGVSTARNSTSLGTSPASMTSAIGGLTSTQKEHIKVAKYNSLDFTLYNFVPIAIETMGTFGAKSLNFIRKLVTCTLYSGDPLASSYLIQCLSVAIQQENAALIPSSAFSVTCLTVNCCYY